jgi:hypothetical protein
MSGGTNTIGGASANASAQVGGSETEERHWIFYGQSHFDLYLYCTMANHHHHQYSHRNDHKSDKVSP